MLNTSIDEIRSLMSAGLAPLLMAVLASTATAQEPSCSDPVTPCPPNSTSGQQPADPDAPGLYADAFGTPIGGCAACTADPLDPGGPSCQFSQWISSGPSPSAPQLQILKFQPPAGCAAELVQAELHVRATMCGVLRIENRDPTNACVAEVLTLESFIDVDPVAGQGIDFLGTLLPGLPLSFTQIVSLAQFDGTIDFMGPSGTAVVASEVQDELCVRITDPMQLAAFVDTGMGPSFLFFDHLADDNSTATGCAPVTFKSDPFSGVEIDVTYTYCVSAPTCESEGLVEGSVGEELVLTWTGDGLAGSLLDFSVSGLPAGAVVSPDPLGGPYPVPVEVTVTWTPAANQTGSHEICVTFACPDDPGSGTTCCTTVNASECHLIFADGIGNDVVTIGGHPYQTQLQGVQDTWPVLLDMMPSFPLTVTRSSAHANGSNASPLVTAIVPLRQFAAQIVMFNPVQFPSNPEQYTQVLAVMEWSDGRVTVQPYGVADGMTIVLEAYRGADGRNYYRFPFQILGL